MNLKIKNIKKHKRFNLFFKIRQKENYWAGKHRTLIIIIKKIIEPGQSIILLDCWKAHYSLKLKGYQYLKVNHFTEIEKEKRS